MILYTVVERTPLITHLETVRYIPPTPPTKKPYSVTRLLDLKICHFAFNQLYRVVSERYSWFYIN